MCSKQNFSQTITGNQEGGEGENDPEPDDTTDSDPDNVRHESGLGVERIPNSRYKRHQKKIKKQNLNVVFNISSVKLTEGMGNVLNRGLNFSILPGKLDITQVLVDWKRFERTMIWKEWWYCNENETNFKENIFKPKKTNLPRNYKVPNGLKTYLGAVKPEIVDPKNRHKAECNIPPDEVKALKELVKL